MRIGGTHYRSIWRDEKRAVVKVIDQRKLPFELEVFEMHRPEDAVTAIRDMVVRGAPLIGVTAAYGICLAGVHSSARKWRENILQAVRQLTGARPTAVNVQYAADRMIGGLEEITSGEELTDRLFRLADAMAEEEVERCRKIGEHGAGLIEEIHRNTGKQVRILTHCNAGWLACVDYGTATAPVYLAHDRGIPVQVWVDETRPRNQGARLTAYELREHGVPHRVIVDNAGGHLMQRGEVDLVLVGSDRTTRTGDVANKIGTYMKALAARDNRVPFYVALPSSSIDFNMERGRDIPIEYRDATEVEYVEGWNESPSSMDTISAPTLTTTTPGRFARVQPSGAGPS
ncbi:MAG: S-methyl-5-thioribose-1-phosphate isomerase [Bacteroidales bacterium]